MFRSELSLVFRLCHFSKGAQKAQDRDYRFGKTETKTIRKTFYIILIGGDWVSNYLEVPLCSFKRR